MVKNAKNFKGLDMVLFKRAFVTLVIGIFLCGGLFAQDIIDVSLNGNDLNKKILEYVDNMAKLIPDSTTTQNIWSYAPRYNRGIFGAGINGSFTMSERTMMGKLLNDRDLAKGFGGKNGDVLSLPSSIPYLPAASFDVRVGTRGFDFGLAGMWASADVIPELAEIIGEDSDYTHRTLGLDVRYALLNDGSNIIFGKAIKGLPSDFIPAVTLQAGYYFTWMSVGFASNSEKTEKVSIDLRNDSYFFAIQVSKDLPLITPFFGLKVIRSNTDSEFKWETWRDVTINSENYPLGAKYESGTTTREPLDYLHLYGGAGISFMYPHILTIGVSYNVLSEHIGISAAVRMIF